MRRTYEWMNEASPVLQQESARTIDGSTLVRGSKPRQGNIKHFPGNSAPMLCNYPVKGPTFMSR